MKKHSPPSIPQLALSSSLVRLKPEKRLYRFPNPLVGLTGGVASGKSTVAKEFARQGLEVISADQLVKNIYQMPETRNFIAQNYPHCANTEHINFALLRETFFSEKTAQEKIEQFIYHRLPHAFAEELSRRNPYPPTLIYDVPLLFEKNLHPLVDVSICVSCTLEQQRERLCHRDQIDLDLAQKILQKQWPLEKKRQLADFTIDNRADLPTLKRNIEQVIQLLFVPEATAKS